MTDKNTGELNMISAGQKVNKLMQDFFTAYFNERDYKAAAGFLREDIRWIGLGAVCSARDRSEAVKFLQAEIAAAPYAVFFEYENVQNAMLSETAEVFLCDIKIISLYIILVKSSAGKKRAAAQTLCSSSFLFLFL